MSSVYKKKKLKDADGTYLLTPSSLDLVFDDEGGKLIDKLTSVNEKLIQKANLSDIEDMATQSYVDDKIAEASLSGGVDLSKYQTKEDSTLATSNKTIVGAINEVNQEVAKKAPSIHTHQATQVTFTDGQTFQQKLDNGSLKGAKGDKGDKGDKGATGSKGADGSKWHNGYHCSGTSTSGTVFPNTGISNARVYDMYINTKPGSADLGNIYVCSASGEASVAQWKYCGNIRGAQGLQGLQGVQGPKGDKGDKGEDYTEVLITTKVSSGKLALTSDKYQYTTLSNGNNITLPSVSKFTQIHLFFEAKTELTLTFPAVKWQKTPDIQALKTYEFIFTYVNGTWLGGWVAYE